MTGLFSRYFRATAPLPGFRAVGLSLVAATLCIGIARAAQEKIATPTGNRYLFIVENSSAMEKRDVALRQAVFDLVNTGVRGRMQSGDTFGIWTFNTGVDTRFPMQTWDASARLDLGTRVNTFLRNQGYHKRSRLTEVMLDLANVAGAVGDLTVVILNDANDKMAGTPFDGEINDLYKQIAPDSEKEKLPVLTGFTIRGGNYVAYSVVPAGQPLRLPPPPERPKPARAGPKAPKTAVAVKTPPRVIPPIIITRTGKDPEAEREAAEAASALAANSAPSPAAAAGVSPTSPTTTAPSVVAAVSQAQTPPPASVTPPLPDGVATVRGSALEAPTSQVAPSKPGNPTQNPEPPAANKASPEGRSILPSQTFFPPAPHAESTKLPVGAHAHAPAPATNVLKEPATATWTLQQLTQSISGTPLSPQSVGTGTRGSQTAPPELAASLSGTSATPQAWGPMIGSRPPLLPGAVTARAREKPSLGSATGAGGFEMGGSRSWWLLLAAMALLATGAMAMRAHLNRSGGGGGSSISQAMPRATPSPTEAHARSKRS